MGQSTGPAGAAPAGKAVAVRATFAERFGNLSAGVTRECGVGERAVVTVNNGMRFVTVEMDASGALTVSVLREFRTGHQQTVGRIELAGE